MSVSSQENGIAVYHRSVINSLGIREQAAADVLESLGRIRIIEDTLEAGQ